MTPAEIKLKRTESVLKELIPEAISQLSDERLKEIDVVDVQCSKGRSDAKVYLDPSIFSPEEQRIFLKLLEKARPLIEEYCMREQGWFRSPKLAFVFDDTLEKSKKIEALFAQIAKEKKE
ncbi:30S ribosome-binding factor RbfA [Sulfuricurvum sp. IAE1]|uniref:30S ribosome-binding factor RbfA n=1 Tax=Sulfuricurvum sp. IAE1 TaxID=2546102 RepID=UPI001050E03A|nr:30S ribosome-binding factor RbfA [Sulfuricurvum sp. IAE1]MDX9965560.1 30S ribosome-binding factor RbfA [Sulfuricurvum sp.]TDA62923.1 30S ribosome-binding factor RbfA [Sulfuricurvum sp. IAE1]